VKGLLHRRRLRCALKLTHDGTVAVADGSKLLASVEMEKLDNRPRWSTITELDDVERILGDLGIAPAAIERWIVDGWVAGEPIRVGAGTRGTLALEVAGYRETSPNDDVLAPFAGRGLSVGGRECSFVSYCHVAGHILGAWASSPFAHAGDPAFVLAWDGGLEPRLYRVDPRARTVECFGPLFHLLGHAYAFATRHFGPFRGIWASGATEPENVVAGRLMAFVALGQPRPELVEELQRLYRLSFGDRTPGDDLELDFRAGSDGSGVSPHASNLFAALAAGGRCAGVPDADVLRAIHDFLEQLLVSRLEARLVKAGIRAPIDLCLSGGCALNIKWNRALRASGLVRDVWVPPFPNDAGSALGMLACDLFRAGGGALDWNAYLGPKLRPDRPPDSEWSVEDCTVAQLAALLDTTGEPVVFLQGRAELGPRALGHRSILASAREASMRDRLNQLKDRDSFRPVAPICLEHRAAEIFDPGRRDPFMLFEHHVRAPWRERIPAVLHLDGSARLQTVAASDEPVLFELLVEFDKRTGVPVLCNTSANFSGSGFFPDAASAARWGRCRHVWAEGKLYTRR
jgi:carbamoyltransferase